MRRFSWQPRDLIWLGILAIAIAYLTRDARQVILVVAVYVAVLFVVKAVHGYVQRLLEAEKPDQRR